MAYMHGTYGEFDKTINTIPVKSGTVPVYIGTAPVNLIRKYTGKGIVNQPVKISNITEAYEKIGYSSDWNSFTLCEAIKAHFDNPIENAGPVVFINVLDPESHVASQQKTVSLTFAKGKAKIKSDKIILDTFAIADKLEGTDYTLEYDFEAGETIIKSSTLSTATASYKEVTPDAVDKDDIIGTSSDEGDCTGLGAAKLVYQELGLITNIIAAPGFSSTKEVYEAMISTASKINGHWDAMVIADLDATTTTSIDNAIEWKKDNDYAEEVSKACWPMWKTTAGDIYHISTLTAWLMLVVDTQNDSVPMETPSNKQIPPGKQYFGEDSTNKGFDQATANKLNAAGITTAVYWGGSNVLWGPHTAAYEYGTDIDKRAIFDNSIRMMMHISNKFQEEWGLTIDKPMTKAMAETIRNREQEKVDALKAKGALIGEPVVEFVETDNPTEELVEGNFTWRNRLTPTPPFKSGKMKIAYTTEGFETEYGGEE